MSITNTARIYARAAHDAVGHVRKYTGLPYWTHCDEVAAIVRTVIHSDEMLCVAWLHDTIEDTKITREQLRDVFGAWIAAGVWDLTDHYTSEAYPMWNRAKRKAAERLRLGLIRDELKTVKLADMIDNTASIVTHDPNFAKVYMAEKRDLLPFLKDGDRRLWEWANKLVTDYFDGQ